MSHEPGGPAAGLFLSRNFRRASFAGGTRFPHLRQAGRVPVNGRRALIDVNAGGKNPLKMLIFVP